MTDHTDMTRTDEALPAPAPGKDGQAPDPARRGFLKAAPLGALAVVAGSSQADEARAPAPASAPQVKRGYHETDHIRRYYQSAAYW